MTGGAKKATIKSLSEEIKNLKEKLKEVDIVKKIVAELEETIKRMNNEKEIDQANKENVSGNKFKCKKCDKLFESNRNLKKHIVNTHPTKIQCTYCEKTFDKNVDFESHVNLYHQQASRYNCDHCEKKFVLKWRLKKHQSMHLVQTSAILKFCHYFNNDKLCPYQEIGCMFRHEQADQCKYEKICSNNLCQFKHKTPNNKVVEIAHESIKNTQEKESIEIVDENDQKEAYFREFYPEIFKKYVKAKKCVECYYCDFLTDKQTLNEIEQEMKTHITCQHEYVDETYDPEVPDNDHQKEFHALFVDE